MKSVLPIEIQRFKQVREDLQLTQQSFAELLELGATTADLERGKTRITGQTVAILLEKYKVNPLWLFGKSEQKYLELSPSVAPKVIAVDPEDRENILLVNVKAAAGYPHNLLDTSWYEQLPAFQLPLPEFRNASFRGFQVDGDSMLPVLQPGEWVLAKAIDQLREVRQNSICVVILQDSVLVKKVRLHSTGDQVSLISLNESYPPVTVPVHEVRELWEVKSKIGFNPKAETAEISLDSLKQAIDSLRDEVAALKR